MRIAAAGNVEIPAFLVLVSKGYSVQRSLDGDIETWCATKGENVFQAESLLQLLGIAVVSEERGQAWRASDEQIDAFLKRFNIEN